MRPLCNHLPVNRPAEVQAIRDLFARSPEFRDAVISDPVLGAGGAVVLEVRRDQETAFRVVAPTTEEAYALLHELVAPLVDRPRGEGACDGG